jgi:hypothetical protein
MPDFLNMIFGEQQPKPGQGLVRFTPDELQEWMNSDDPPTSEDLAKLHPADLKVVYSLIEQGEKSALGAAGMALGVPGMLSGAKAALSAPGLGQKAMQLGAEALPYVAPAVGAGIGAKLGSPTAGWLIGTMLGGRNGRGRSTPKPVEEPLPPNVPATMTSTGQTATPARMNGFSTPRQSTTTATPNAARPPKLGEATPQGGPPPNVQRIPATGVSGLGSEELPAQVQRGVQNDFRGRVTFQKDAPPRPKMNYPRGRPSALLQTSTASLRKPTPRRRAIRQSWKPSASLSHRLSTTRADESMGAEKVDNTLTGLALSGAVGLVGWVVKEVREIAPLKKQVEDIKANGEYTRKQVDAIYNHLLSRTK